MVSHLGREMDRHVHVASVCINDSNIYPAVFKMMGGLGRGTNVGKRVVYFGLEVGKHVANRNEGSFPEPAIAKISPMQSAKKHVEAVHSSTVGQAIAS